MVVDVVIVVDVVDVVVAVDVADVIIAVDVVDVVIAVDAVDVVVAVDVVDVVVVNNVAFVVTRESVVIRSTKTEGLSHLTAIATITTSTRNWLYHHLLRVRTYSLLDSAHFHPSLFFQLISFL